MDTQIVNTKNIRQKNTETQLIEIFPTKILFQNKMVDKKQTLNIKENETILLDSYIDKNRRNIFLKKLINSGSFNDVFNFNYKKSAHYDPNYIIRISNSSSTLENINSELHGIQKQYKLCAKNKFIGQIIDYGKIYAPSRLIKYRLTEYSIQRRYGLSLGKILSKNPKYKSFKMVLLFMKNFLQAIHSIHQSGFAHLDLKPDNILLKYRHKFGNGIFDNLDFVIVDFGAAHKFKNDKSDILEEQMASAAFSPPELLQRMYGKKSDIWAYGVICYLVCIRKFFLKARAQHIFLGEKKNIIYKNINKSMNNLLKNVVPKYIKSDNLENMYLKPLNKNNFYILEDFLYETFKIESINRSNSKQLLNHKLFTLK